MDIIISQEWTNMFGYTLDSESNRTIQTIINPIIRKFESINSETEFFIENEKIFPSMQFILRNSGNDARIVQQNLIVKFALSQIRNSKIINPYYIYASFFIETPNPYGIEIREAAKSSLPPKSLFSIDIPDITQVSDILSQYSYDPYISVMITNGCLHIIKIFDTYEDGTKWLDTLPYPNSEPFETRIKTQLTLNLIDMMKGTTIFDLLDAIYNFPELQIRLFANFTK